MLKLDPNPNAIATRIKYHDVDKMLAWIEDNTSFVWDETGYKPTLFANLNEEIYLTVCDECHIAYCKCLRPVFKKELSHEEFRLQLLKMDRSRVK